MANSQDDSSSQHPDLLAAVVLHTLVSEARNGMTAAAVALACERDPRERDDIDEIEAALQILLEDGLAEREPRPRREPDGASQLDTTLEHPTTPGPHKTTLKLHTTPEATTLHASPQSLYRPTRAAIRARELSF